MAPAAFRARPRPSGDPKEPAKTFLRRAAISQARPPRRPVGGRPLQQPPLLRPAEPRVSTPILWSIRQTRTEKMATAPGGFQKISSAAPPKEARRRAGSIPRRRCLPGPQGGGSDQERHTKEDSLGAAERPHTGARTAGSKRQHCRYCQALTNIRGDAGPRRIRLPRPQGVNP